MDFKSVLKELEVQGNLRKLPANLPSDFIDFTSNDYLGLASDHNLSKEFIDSVSDFRFSSSASRLLASIQDCYSELEDLLAKEYQRSILLFNSGYHANSGIIPAISSDSKCLIVADKLVHASIIDGVMLSRCEFRRYPHNDMKSLRKIVEKYSSDFERIIIITESIYSMDGDVAPLNELLEIKKEFQKVFLYLDEAHAFGVKGKKGLGLSQNSKSPSEWDIIVVPMGKAAASMGAFAVCNQEIKEFLINKTRSLIFSTALPPIQIQWNIFILRKIFGMDEERSHLENISHLLYESIKNNFNNQKNSNSHIQPLIIGDPFKAKKISDFLFDNKIKALPIRKPTVPAGTERLRFSLTAGMKTDDIHNLDKVLKEVQSLIS